MRLSATVTVEGQAPVLVETRPVDILKWEAGTKKKITDGIGYGDMLQIIHSAAKRTGLTEQAFSDWAASLEDFDPVTPPPDPTQTDQSTD
jgi:peptidyl-tRNA hydrolase